jgi:hypothetical protein
MDANHRKIRRKTTDLHGQKARIGHMILEETATKPKVAMQIKAVVGAECKTNLSTACVTSHITETLNHFL